MKTIRITEDNKDILKTIEKVRGNLSIEGNFTADAELLTNISGELSISQGARINMKLLINVRNIKLYDNSCLYLDSLEAMKGDIELYNSSVLTANALKRVSNVILTYLTSFTARNLQAIIKELSISDNAHTVLSELKRIDSLTVNEKAEVNLPKVIDVKFFKIKKTAIVKTPKLKFKNDEVNS